MNRFPLVALAAIALAGCSADAPRRVSGPATPVALTRIASEYYSRLVQPARLVINDAVSFAAIWNQAYGGRSPVPPIPTVDFRHETVIVTALGERSSGGFGIRMTGAAQEGSVIVVEVESSSSVNCPVTSAMTQPIDMVKIPVRARGARFVERLVANDCSQP